MSEHSKLTSPSAMGRRVICPGSGELEAQTIDTGSPAARRGTFGHIIVNEYHTKKLYPKTALGTTYTEDNNEPVICDQGLVDAAIAAGTDAKRLIRSFKSDGVVSHEVGLSGLFFGWPDFFGTSDMTITSQEKKALVVLDYKFGQYPVSPDSVQNKCYGVLAAGGPLGLAAYDKVTLAISQPARPDSKGDSLHRYTTTGEELLVWYNEVLLPTLECIQAGDAPRKYNPEACKYCSGKKFCPEYSAATLPMLASLKLPEQLLTVQKVAELYPQIAEVESFIKVLKEEGRKLVEQGQLPGFKLVAGRGRRAFNDEDAAKSLITAAGFDAFENKLLSPAKAEALSKPLKKDLQGLIVKIAGNPSVVPEADKRKALPVASDEFLKLVNAQLGEQNV